MPTDVLTAAARKQVAGIALADRILLALVAGVRQIDEPDLTDDQAPAIWQAVALRLQGHQNGVYARRAEVGLVDLNERLANLMSRVRSAGRDADLSAELAEYRAIRAAQLALNTTYNGRQSEIEFTHLALRVPLGLLMKTAGVIRNIDQVWPDWRNAMRGAGYSSPPWQHEDQQPFVLLPTAVNLRWLASPPAEPWVPTLEQAARAVVEQTAAEEKRLLSPTTDERRVEAFTTYV